MAPSMPEAERYEIEANYAATGRADKWTTTARKAKTWSDRMTDHIAWALLAYTGLQIFVTIQAIKGEGGSILPYFSLVLLVGAIIPLCRRLERKWERLEASGVDADVLNRAFSRDRLAVWLMAIGLPFAIAGIAGGLNAAF